MLSAPVQVGPFQARVGASREPGRDRATPSGRKVPRRASRGVARCLRALLVKGRFDTEDAYHATRCASDQRPPDGGVTWGGQAAVGDRQEGDGASSTSDNTCYDAPGEPHGGLDRDMYSWLAPNQHQ